MREDHRRWRQLFKTFFSDLLEHLAPELRGELYFDAAFCLELEALGLDLDPGLDLGANDAEDSKTGGFTVVAEVPHRRHGDCLVMVQAETERRPRSRVEAQLERGYRRLRFGLERPVLPIVLFMAPGESGFANSAGSAAGGRRCLVRGDAGVPIFRLDYRTFHLTRARAESHLGRSPLAPALAARMHTQRWSREQLQLECMAAVLSSTLDDRTQRSMLRLIEAPSQAAIEGSGAAQSASRRTRRIRLSGHDENADVSKVSFNPH